MVLMGCGWNDAFQKYKQLTGDTPAGGTFHYEFNGDTKFFWHNAKDNVGPGGVLHVNFNLVSNTSGSLKPYLKGEKDEEIKKIGLAFKTWGHPLYVTLGTECDFSGHKYTAQQFITVYRKIHKIWDDLGVTNVAYVWHLIGDGKNPQWAYHYPGDDYVDWVAFSFYYLENNLPYLRVVSRLAHKHHKPLMVAESGPINGKAHAFSDWHGPFLRHAMAFGVKVICYNNWRNPPVGDEFLNSSFDRQPESIVHAWAREMQRPCYLHAEWGLERQLYTPPIKDTIPSQVTTLSSPRRAKNGVRSDGSPGRYRSRPDDYLP